MAHAEKRDGRLTGRWFGEVDQRHKSGPRFRRAFQTKREAEGYEAYVKTTGQEPPGLALASDGRTFAAVAQELRAAGGPGGLWDRGRDPGVLQRLSFLEGHRLGQLPVERVDYAAAEKLAEELKARPTPRGGLMKPSTVNRYLTAITCVLKYASQKGYIAGKPEMPWQEETRRKQPLYRPGQIAAMTAWLRTNGRLREAFAVEVLERTGMRVGELLGLRREQIEDDFVLLDDPERIKNEETRLCWVGEDMARELRALIAAGGMPTYHNLDYFVRSANEAVGNSITRPIHAIRHTAATNTVAAEQDLQVAQQLLGHKDIATTLRYRHVSRDVLRERAKKLHPRVGEIASEAEVIAFPAVDNAGKKAG